MSAASPSGLVSGRLPSSLSRVTSSSQLSPLSLSVTRLMVVSGTISSSSRPACCAAAMRVWLANAYSSCASRETP